MIQFTARDFTVLQRLKSTWHTLKILRDENPAGIPDEKKRTQLVDLLNEVFRMWVKIGLIGEAEMVENVIYHLTNVPNKNYSEVAESVRLIILKTHNELDLRSFAYIPIDRDCFFEQSELFGKAVKEAASEEINSEIKAAGNCLAAGLNTAAVFHAIRTAEMGMRCLASRLRAKIDRDGERIKIDEATWEELIKGINKRIESEKLKLKAKRKVKSQFRDYEILVSQFNRLKDDRNEVMHTHGDYKASEALGVFERVRDFMQRLAKRIPLK
jgi:hypothetical protein